MKSIIEKERAARKASAKAKKDKLRAERKGLGLPEKEEGEAPSPLKTKNTTMLTGTSPGSSRNQSAHRSGRGGTG